MKYPFGIKNLSAGTRAADGLVFRCAALSLSNSIPTQSRIVSMTKMATMIFLLEFEKPHLLVVT
jgi:hypothetical protein